MKFKKRYRIITREPFSELYIVQWKWWIFPWIDYIEYFETIPEAIRAIKKKKMPKFKVVKEITDSDLYGTGKNN